MGWRLGPGIWKPALQASTHGRVCSQACQFVCQRLQLVSREGFTVQAMGGRSVSLPKAPLGANAWNHEAVMPNPDCWKIPKLCKICFEKQTHLSLPPPPLGLQMHAFSQFFMSMLGDPNSSSCLNKKFFTKPVISLAQYRFLNVVFGLGYFL